MDYISLAWQVPAIFTAVPMVHRLLPFKLAARAIPLFYFVIAMVVMVLPGRVDIALGAAGLVTILHSRVGVSLSTDPGPDMPATWNKIVYTWDLLANGFNSLRLPVFPVPRRNQDASLHDTAEDDNQDYAEPPRPPEGRVASRIPHLE